MAEQLEWMKEITRTDNKHEKVPYSELFWSVFSRIWTECGAILRISPYSVRMRGTVDQNNSNIYLLFIHFLFV